MKTLLTLVQWLIFMILLWTIGKFNASEDAKLISLIILGTGYMLCLPKTYL